jgi:ribose 5-phosphate isomerase A
MPPDMHKTPDIARQAVELIPAGGVVGLGTGRAATAFIHALGVRVRSGFQVRGIPTSDASANLATQLGIPLVTFDDVERIDVTVDGADEVDPAGDLIKGYGGALLREKIVAAFSRQLVILVGSEKLVPVLGSRGILPVEVVPFALTPCRRHLAALGFTGEPRVKDGTLYVTDNGNYILDCKTAPLTNPAATDAALHAIPGIVGTGLFIKRAHLIMVQNGEKVEVRRGGAQ